MKPNPENTYKISCPEFWDEKDCEFASTLKEAKKIRTICAAGVGCAPWSVYISRRNTVTNTYTRIT